MLALFEVGDMAKSVQRWTSALIAGVVPVHPGKITAFVKKSTIKDVPVRPGQGRCGNFWIPSICCVMPYVRRCYR